MSNILVTGGSGFIGGQACIQLVETNHNVVNLDKVYREHENVHIVTTDLADADLPYILNLANIDTIMHFAAFHEVGLSVSSPGTFYDNNVSNTISLLNAVVETGVEKFIFSSSSSVYGDIKSFPTPEDTPKAPISSYGRSKAIIEDILPDYEAAYGLKYIALRYFNAAGADPKVRWGYRQEKATHIVPIILRALIDKKPISIFGNDYPTPDGTCIRDYTHVSDIASAHIAAMNYDGPSDVFNIGSGVGNSLMELIVAIEKVTGLEVEYEIMDRRPGDPPRTRADTTKVEAELGWKPTKFLEEIIIDAWNWELQQTIGFNKMVG